MLACTSSGWVASQRRSSRAAPPFEVPVTVTWAGVLALVTTTTGLPAGAMIWVRVAAAWAGAVAASSATAARDAWRTGRLLMLGWYRARVRSDPPRGNSEQDP